MINHKLMPNFIIDIIRYADDKDIGTLLLNSKAKSYQWKLQLLGNNGFKRKLLTCLFDYIYEFIEPDLFIKPDLDVENSEIIEELPLSAPPYLRKRIANHKLLYLHLYALSECYHSYQCYFPDEDKKEMYNLQKAFSKEFGTDKNKKVLTEKDITKLLHLFINSYTENGFYYYFYDNELVKLEIKQTTSKVFKQKYIKDYKYAKTVYELEEHNDSTIIVNNEIGINTDLKSKLLRENRIKTVQEEINHNEDNFVEILAEILNVYDFQDIKNIHEKLIKILKISKKETCKCCNPDVNKIKSTKICGKCKKLFKEISDIQGYIDVNTNSNELYKFKNKNIRSDVYKISIDKTGDLNKLSKKRKIFLRNTIKKLLLETNKAMLLADKINCKIENEDRKDRTNYAKIEDIAKNLETLISDIFDD